MIIRIAVAAIVTAALTWALGWWAIALVAFASGMLPRAYSVRGGWMALAGALGWGALLTWHALHPAFGPLLVRLESVLGVPGVLVLVVALLFAALLGWSASVVGNAIGSVVARRTNTSNPASRATTDYDSISETSHVAMSESSLR